MYILFFLLNIDSCIGLDFSRIWTIQLVEVTNEIAWGDNVGGACV